jgi:hypothetical protein
MWGKIPQLLYIRFPVHEYLEHIGTPVISDLIPPGICADGAFQIDVTDHDPFPFRKRSRHDFPLG